MSQSILTWYQSLTNPLRQDTYIPPKRPYSFEALLSDILVFAANMLVENGRLGLWMPTANDEEIELAIPEHPALAVESACVQPFHKCKSHIMSQHFQQLRLLDCPVNNNGLLLTA